MSETAAPTTLSTLPEVASPEQVAHALGLCAKAVRKALRDGEIRGARVCGRWRVRRVDVEALFTEDRAARPQEAAPVIVTAVAARGAAGRPKRVSV